MSIKSDNWIRRMSLEEDMIKPFEPKQIRRANDQKIISYGTSSYGYDVRCSTEFKIFTNINHNIVDPKNFNEQSFVEVNSDECIIPPNSFALASTVEYFKIPRSTLVICLGKSTYARCGIIVNVTPLEPEWEGHVTVSYTHLRAHETKANLVCRLLLEKKKKQSNNRIQNSHYLNYYTHTNTN